MLLGELLERKKYLELQIKELEVYLLLDDEKDVNETVNKLFELKDKLQKYTIQINNNNYKVEVTIGKSTISLSNAIILRDTVEYKINMLTNLINEISERLDIFNLMEQRNKIIDEKLIFDKAISNAKWMVEL